MQRLLILFAVVFISGCATTDETASSSKPDMNFLGIVKVENESYAPTGSASPTVSEGDVLPNENPTGRKVELLWGLFTFTDY